LGPSSHARPSCHRPEGPAGHQGLSSLCRRPGAGHSGCGVIPAWVFGGGIASQAVSVSLGPWGEEMAVALSSLGRKGRRPAIMFLTTRAPLSPAAPALSVRRSWEAI
jgi:hypothetical protein